MEKRIVVLNDGAVVEISEVDEEKRIRIPKDFNGRESPRF